MSRLNVLGIAAFLALFVTPIYAQPRADLPAQDVRADFAELYTRIQESHFDLFARRSKSDYDSEYSRVLAGLTAPMRPAAVRAAFQKFLAYGRVAHANIDFPAEDYNAYRASGGRVLALFPRIDGETARVGDLYSGNRDIRRGDEILAVDGEEFPIWLARLSKHVSADNPYMAASMIETRFPALFWLDVGSRDRASLRLRRDGVEFESTVPFRTRPEILAEIETQPKGLDLDPSERVARMEGDIAYLRPGVFFNLDENPAKMWETTAFGAFIDAAFGNFIDAGARTLLIDLRDNPGGDNSFSDLMVRRFANQPFRFCKSFTIKVSRAAVDSNAKRLMDASPDAISQKLAAAYARSKPGDKIEFEIPIVQPLAARRFQGRVFILVNRRTYSNSVQVAALAQDYRFAKILGEETADLATTYGAMETFTLSRTGITVNFPKALIVRVNGDLSPRGVVPDITIPTPLVQGTDDPVLAAALSAVRSAK